MSFLLELLGELCIECGTSKRVSKWIRIPILLVLAFLYCFLIYGLFALGIKMFLEHQIGPGIMFLGLAVFVVFAVIKYIQKLRKS